MSTPPLQRPIVSIGWRLDEHDSRDHVRLHAIDEGIYLAGTTVLTVDGCPTSIDYLVEADHRWRPLGATIEIRAGVSQPHRIEIIADDGHWRVDGVVDPAFDGCHDIDLGWTPATNFLPVRRHDIDVGESFETEAVMVCFPEVGIQRRRQCYTRLDESLWRYESGRFSRDLTLDDHGFVTAYGDDLWQVAGSAG
jgi:hypothetical protein